MTESEETREEISEDKDPLQSDPILSIISFIIIMIWVMISGYMIDTSGKQPYSSLNVIDYKNFIALLGQILGVVAGFLIAVFAYAAQSRNDDVELLRSKNFNAFYWGVLRNYFDLIILGATAIWLVFLTYICMMDYANSISVDSSTITVNQMSQQVTDLMSDFRFGFYLLVTSVVFMLIRKLKILSEKRKFSISMESNTRMDKG